MYEPPLFTAEAIMDKTKLHLWEGSIPNLAESMFALYQDILSSELKLRNHGVNYNMARLEYITNQQLTPELKQELIDLISLKKIDSLL